MPSLRPAWTPLTPLAALLVLSLAVLATPAEQHAGWLGLVVLLASPVAAFAAARALRAAVARAPAGPPGGATTRGERRLLAALQWLLAVVAVLVPGLTLVAEVGRQAGRLGPLEMALVLALPLGFAFLGARLWRDLLSARAHRATEVEPWRLLRASTTGVPGLDARIGRSPRAARRIAWALGFASAAAWVADQVVRGQPIVAMLMKVNDRVRDGEVWRIFTATLVHGSLSALAVNGLAFWAVAPMVELLLGGPRLVFAFVVGGVVATGASFAFAPGPYMGASGAVATTAAALLAFAARRWRALPRETRRRAVAQGGLALSLAALAAVSLPEVDAPAIAGGAAFGLLAGLAFAPPEDTRLALERLADGAR